MNGDGSRGRRRGQTVMRCTLRDLECLSGAETRKNSLANERPVTQVDNEEANQVKMAAASASGSLD